MSLIPEAITTSDTKIVTSKKKKKSKGRSKLSDSGSPAAQFNESFLEFVQEAIRDNPEVDLMKRIPKNYSHRLDQIKRQPGLYKGMCVMPER